MSEAASAGKGAGKGAAKEPKGGVSLKWWHGLILGLLLAYVPGSVLVGGVLLLPLLVLRLADPRADRQRMMIALFYLGAVMVHPLREAWLLRGDWHACLAEITRPTLLALDWAAIGVAWFVSEFSALVTKLWYLETARRERKSVETRIAALREEWGIALPEFPNAEDKAAPKTGRKAG